MSTQASDLLCVLWFAKQSGLWKTGKQKESKKSKSHISIAPLFETIDDLQRAQHIIRSLHSNTHYRQYLYDNNNTQAKMVESLQVTIISTMPLVISRIYKLN